MFARLLLLFIVAFLLYLGLRVLLAKQNLTPKQFTWIYAASLLGVALLFLGVTGRLHPVFAVLGAVLPFLGRLIGFIMRGAQFAAFLKMLRGLGLGGIASGGAAGQAPATSEIQSRYIHMVLSHDTGMMDGTVLEGQYKDRKLSSMSLDELTGLLGEIQHDADSCNLLLAYLDREHEDWQEGKTRPETPSLDDNMTEAQALDILGLPDQASRDDVIQAHRRMMQKMHPDRGGSTYLAAKINAAKDLLMQLRGED